MADGARVSGGGWFETDQALFDEPPGKVRSNHLHPRPDRVYAQKRRVALLVLRIGRSWTGSGLNAAAATVRSSDQGKGVVMRIVRIAGTLTVMAALWLAIGVSSVSAAAVVKTIPVGSDPGGVSSDGTHVWVTNIYGGTVSEIDASTGTVVNTIPVGRFPGGVSSDGTHVWVANDGGGTVSEIDASTGKVVRKIKVGKDPGDVSSDGTHVWVTNYGDDTVSEIDASTGKVVKTINKVGRRPEGVSSHGTHVWVANYHGDTVSEIDASTGKVVKKIKVGRRPGAVSAHGTHVWVTNSYGDTVSEIDASTGKVVRKIKVGKDPGDVSSDGTHVWVTNDFKHGTVSEIDASTGKVVKKIKVGHDPYGVSSDGTHVWVASSVDDTVSEIKISKRCVVPKLTGRTLAAAKTALKQADCAVGKITKRKSSTVPKARVISSSPKAGSKHKAGTKSRSPLVAGNTDHSRAPSWPESSRSKRRFDASPRACRLATYSCAPAERDGLPKGRLADRPSGRLPRRRS